MEKNPKKQNENNRTFVLGDVHGSYKALMQVIDKSGIDYNNDRLICLGDVADGWPEIVECFEELLKFKNLIYVKGNHDSWLQHWLERGDKPDIWTMQGGRNTQNSYIKNHHDLWIKHRKFLKKVPYYFVDEKNRVYVHGGLKPDIPVGENEKMYLLWDRELWDNRHNIKINQYSEVFIGHTSIYNFSHFPLNYNNI